MTYRPAVLTLAVTGDAPGIWQTNGLADSTDLWGIWHGRIAPHGAVAFRVSHIPTGCTNRDAFATEADAKAWCAARMGDEWRTKSPGRLVILRARETAKDRVTVPNP